MACPPPLKKVGGGDSIFTQIFIRKFAKMSAAKTSVYVADPPPYPPMLRALELHAIYVLHVLVVVVVEVLHVID